MEGIVTWEKYCVNAKEGKRQQNFYEAVEKTKKKLLADKKRVARGKRMLASDVVQDEHQCPKRSAITEEYDVNRNSRIQPGKQHAGNAKL